VDIAAVALLALIFVTLVARTVLWYRRSPDVVELPEVPPAHRFELTSADGRSMALQTDTPLSREEIERFKHDFRRMGELESAPAGHNWLEQLVKLRYVVELRGNEGEFAGILTEQQVVALPDGRPELMLVFEHCKTVPTHEGDTADNIAGRVILGMSGIAYLQQVG